MKLCFVTVGATASFELLLQYVFNKTFLSALKQHGYTHLLVQYGKDGQAICENFTKNNPEGSEARHGIEIAGFDFNQAGLGEEMRLAQANAEFDQEGGMIISHAGSILEAMRLGVPLVVVPNPSLKDNHQKELANELQKQGYVIASNVKEVFEAVSEAEALRSHMLRWPPVRRRNQRQPTLEQVMSDELGFVD
ncbi:N-acetylglucosaminyldiphosphodolichol N-acetylglucosaminyltransferase catalytic subunit ALG13 [Aspergillus glaucus CBS 516.65]|uniref:UDP-N-acetylglucosamine transferase subunit ALG13 n=1 Tax=Aspergillus glaucus CBS 516.65 TaxID=1160497 RepID=A0A1L9VG88_ASPGL|nr:hypothetical protein ASPGLDRAFT_517841 [Aspergillus glaucus CBS 516.65]OJJ82905.1 hypothetical protein ASPGLDRAFT_517841 [Aspergillus glaucus CBS 516.65]